MKPFFIVTVLAFVAVTGFVTGCDSDDTPTVTPPSGGGIDLDLQAAAANGKDCLELTSEHTRNRCNYDLIVGVKCEGDTSFVRVIRYSPGETRSHASCFSSASEYSPCTAPARPRLEGDNYTCHRT